MDTLTTGVVSAVTTLPDRALALQLGRQAVQQRLAACAQVDEQPITSIYHWQGTLCEEAEWRLTFKTSVATEPTLRHWLAQQHPYQTPQWLVTPAQTSAGYAAWAAQMTG